MAVAAPTSAARRQGGYGAALWTALWTLYLVWGSTYLAIRVLVHPSVGEGIPPLLGGGARFCVAGAVLFVLSVRQPTPDGRPDRLGWPQWRSAAVVGTALLLGGNGFVSIAEQHVASGPAAVLIATVPIWAAIMAAAVGQERVSRRHATGLGLGFLGVATLTLGSGGGRIDALGVSELLLAALLWSGGSVWSRTAPLPRRPLVMTAMEMLCGGTACLLAGVASGELNDLHLSAVPVRSWVALGYLITVGSMAGYTAYVWLLKNAPLPLAMTYAYVNPVVAVLLGMLVLHESFTLRMGIATAVIVFAVALIVTRNAAERSV